MHFLKAKLIIAAGLAACTADSFGQIVYQRGARTSAVISDVGFGGAESNSTVDIDGGRISAYASSSVSDLRGATESTAELLFIANQNPILRSRSYLSGDGSAHAFGGAFASEIFQYIGTNPGTLQLTFTLEGIVADLPGDTQTFVKARVGIFELPNYEFTSDFDSLVFESHATAKAFDLTTLQILDDTGGLMAQRETTLQFNVLPGELFYVWQTLDTSARGDARFADAFNTLTTQFDHPELVVANVPEPVTLACLMCGMVVLGFGRRRNRT